MSPDQRVGLQESFPSGVADKALNMAANVAGKHTLPVNVFVATRIPEQGIFGIELIVRWFDNSAVNITARWIGQLAKEATITDIADEILLEGNPSGKALICDQELADELAKNSLSFVGEDHYRLQGRESGVLEVFVPYTSKEASFVPGRTLEVYTEE